MIVRVTGDFAKQIGASATSSLPLSENPFADWTCRVFSAREGEPLLLITNTASLYSLLVPAAGLGNQEQFHSDLIACLEWHLVADGLETILTRHLTPELNSLLVSKSLNRSVTGSMNDMVKLSVHMIDEEHKTLEEVAAKLNETPFGALGYNHPREQFKGLVV